MLPDIFQQVLSACVARDKMSIVYIKSEILSNDCIADSERNKGAFCVSVSLSMTVCVCDVSIKGRKPNDEVNVWSLSDIDISNLCLAGIL